MSRQLLDATELMQQLGEAVVATDPAGTITLFNAAAERLYGWTADEVIGCSVVMLTPGPIAEQAGAEREHVRGGETRRLLGSVPTNSGACTVELSLAPLRDASGAIVGSIGVTRDVSAAILRERQFEFMSQLVSETDTVAVVGTDRDGLITLFNQGAEELLGYTAREAIGHLNGLVLVQAVVDIARGLGTQTVAEFVGDDETVELLRHLGVDYGQGYHLGRPAAIEELLPALS